MFRFERAEGRLLLLDGLLQGIHVCLIDIDVDGGWMAVTVKDIEYSHFRGTVVVLVFSHPPQIQYIPRIMTMSLSMHNICSYVTSDDSK